ncbi:hypothetical protein NQ317_002391 [Molorchus minor]|uniref:Uncharacterized protein n=1 Tax=Molorchus minor TaxID=1323400 RepID=A0ABQ9J7R1_9CUCU|nr:hypothetical protein NQ317_002391 [Molorchus minor]
MKRTAKFYTNDLNDHDKEELKVISKKQESIQSHVSVKIRPLYENVLYYKVVKKFVPTCSY